jgi:hypothetical protein
MIIVQVVYRILTGKTLQLPEDEPDITDTEINALLQVDIGGPPPPHQDKIIKVAPLFFTSVLAPEWFSPDPGGSYFLVVPVPDPTPKTSPGKCT